MRRILLIFLLLVSAFFITWGVKANTLVARPDNIEDGKVVAWYESSYTAPTSDDEWYIDPSIDEKYIKMPGKDDIYMEVDEKGNVIGYVQRIKQANGEYTFETYNKDIPENYEKVPGVKDVYKVTDENGKTAYKKYVRNKDDNTFAFVDVDKNGKMINLDTDATKIDSKHKLVDSKTNLYALYNDDNVKVGYVKRKKNKKGKYKWVEAEPPKMEKVGNDGVNQFAEESKKKMTASTDSSDTSGEEPAPLTDEEIINADGTRTDTELKTSSETKDGYKYIYQTPIVTTYDKDGNVVSIKEGERKQVSKEKLVGSDATPDPTQIAGTLDKELSRVSSKVSFNTKKANQLLALINAEREQEGLPSLKMDTSSDIYKVAQISAADMAIYNHASNTSPMYGKLDDFNKRFGLNLVNITGDRWKTSERSAQDINNRFQSTYSETRMSKFYNQVGIGIVDQDGMTYVIEVFAQ